MTGLVTQRRAVISCEGLLFARWASHSDVFRLNIQTLPNMSDPGRSPVRRRLEALGFEVVEIAEDANQKRPDLRAAKDGVSMLVEVKTRLEDLRLRQGMESGRVGEDHDVVVSLDKSDSLSAHIANANAQLEATASPSDLRLLWLRDDNGLFVQGLLDQAGATLLGIRMTFVIRNGMKRHLPCIYAGYADFFRYRAIDAAVVERDGALVLFPNPFSSRRTAFCESPIRALLADSVVDIDKSERDGECYVIDDSDVNRNDDAELLTYLQAKYPSDEFFRFGIHAAGTTVTTIDARSSGNAQLQSMEPLSARVIKSFVQGQQSEEAFWSHFASAIATDLQTFPENQAPDPTGSDALSAATGANDLFNRLRIPIYFNYSPHLQIFMWERTLAILKDADERRYEALHKGTPFYFLGIAAYIAEDFERALFYMDCALAEDCRLHGPRWHLNPSGMFIRLDDDSMAQAGHLLVADAKHLFDLYGDKVAAAGGIRLSLDGYRARLVNRSAQQQPELRSAVTAFLSFLLEIKPRTTQLELAPIGTGTGEPFFLHLFKGAILFETLLRASPAGRPVVRANPKATLGNLLSASDVIRDLALGGPPQGLGAHTLADVLAAVETDATSGATFSERAVRAVWGLRNTTGHNLAWPQKPSNATYEQLLILLVGGIMLAITNLFREELLESGEA